MPFITRTRVNYYIRAARAVAVSDADLLCIRTATELNSAGVVVAAKRKGGAAKGAKSGVWIGEIHASADDGYERLLKPRRRNPESKEQTQALLWKNLILEEINSALCTHKKYKKQVADLKKSADFLIIAISAYIAGAIGVGVGVVSALVAAILRVICSMGVGVFCRRFAVKE